jgi:hypothetical protein
MSLRSVSMIGIKYSDGGAITTSNHRLVLLLRQKIMGFSRVAYRRLGRDRHR